MLLGKSRPAAHGPQGGRKLQTDARVGPPLGATAVSGQLMPVDSKAYPSFTPADLQRLRSSFPGGTCDFSKPGVNQTRVVPWASFGPAPENLVFDIRQHTTSTDITKH